MIISISRATGKIKCDKIWSCLKPLWNSINASGLGNYSMYLPSLFLLIKLSSLTGRLTYNGDMCFITS